MNALKCSSKNCRSKLIEIKNLLPFYDYNECFLRVGGRITKSSLTLETVFQYIMSKTHFITKMIIEHKHAISSHCSANYVLLKLLEKFWVCSGINTIREHLSNCQFYRLRRANSVQQVMCYLPECRLTIPKFLLNILVLTSLVLSLGRSLVKRWGVLFICMASRACHIKISPDVSTDS